MSDYGIFSSYEDHKERRTGKIRGALPWMCRALDGWVVACAQASPAQRLHHHGPLGTSIFLISLPFVALRNLDLFIKADFSLNNISISNFLSFHSPNCRSKSSNKTHPLCFTYLVK